MYEQNVLSGHNKVIQAHVQSRATGIEKIRGTIVLRAVVGARPGFRIARSAAPRRFGLLRLNASRVALPSPDVLPFTHYGRPSMR